MYTTAGSSRFEHLADASLTPSKSQVTKRKTESGAGGPRSVPRPVSTLTLSSLSYSSLKASLSCACFCPSIEWLTGAQQGAFLTSIRAPWFRQLCAMPQAIWLRCSGVVSNRVPFTLKEAPSYSPRSPRFLFLCQNGCLLFQLLS